MSAFVFPTRRMLLRDMGKAGLAVMILGTAACASESTGNATPTPETTEGGSTTGPSPTSAPGSTAPAETSSDGAHEWHRVNLGFVSAYLLYRGGEAAIVDTGVTGSEGAIGAALGEIGLGWGDVGTVVITHLHPDHQGSLPAVIEATTDVLPWFAGAADLAAIEAPTQGQAVGDGDAVFRGLQIIETPGHTPGHISVLDPVAGILVAGDAINGGNGGVVGPDPDFSDDMEVANASVTKLAGFDYDVILFGHGEPVLEDGSTLVGNLTQSSG